MWQGWDWQHSHGNSNLTVNRSAQDEGTSETNNPVGPPATINKQSDTDEGYSKKIYAQGQQAEMGKKIAAHSKDKDKTLESNIHSYLPTSPLPTQEPDGSESATLNPGENNSHFSFNLNEALAITLSCSPLDMAPQIEGSFVSSNEHWFHNTLLPLPTTTTDTFFHGHLQYTKDRIHTVLGPMSTFHDTITHTDNTSIVQLMKRWLASVSKVLHVTG